MRHLLVTGAAGGLGSVLVQLLLSEGHRVTAVARRQASLDQLAAAVEGAIETRVCDVTDGDAFRLCLSGLSSPLDGVAHLVGGYGGAGIEDAEVSLLGRLHRLNVQTAFIVIQEATRHFSDTARPGSVVCVGSMMGRHGGSGHAAYAPTKAAVHALVRSAASDLAAGPIRINAVLPGTIATPANLEAMPDADHRQWVTPAQVGSVIGFLLGDASSGVTGACIEVAGHGFAP